MEECSHFVRTGACKYGEECRFAHSHTLAVRVDCHAHPLGPDAATKRKKFFCNECNQKV